MDFIVGLRGIPSIYTCSKEGRITKNVPEAKTETLQINEE
jgi:hypothetical protein